MNRRSIAYTGLAVAGLLALGWPLLRRPPERPAAPPVAAPPAREPAPAAAALPMPAASPAADPAQRLHAALDRLRAEPMAERRALVEGLLAELDALSPGARSAAALAFLRSDMDLDLGGQFVPGPGGWLVGWPSLRLALMDHLARVDAATARLYARELLVPGPPASPGEWTLALRELTRGAPAGRWPTFVGQRMVDLLRHPAWEDDPPRAFLEAVDLVVAGGAVQVLPELDQLLRSAAPAGRFAAFMALDRLTLAQPAAVLAELNAHPGWLAATPALRATLFARADVREPGQRTELERYLQRSDLAATERAGFAERFPHYDVTVSHNLLTGPSGRSLSDMRAHDAAARRLIEQWRTRPDLAAWQELWETVLERLDSFEPVAPGA